MINHQLTRGEPKIGSNDGDDVNLAGGAVEERGEVCPKGYEDKFTVTAAQWWPPAQRLTGSCWLGYIGRGWWATTTRIIRDWSAHQGVKKMIA